MEEKGDLSDFESRKRKYPLSSSVDIMNVQPKTKSIPETV